MYSVAPTRNAHPVGSTVRRLVEGTGERYDQHVQDAQRQRDIRTGSRTRATMTTDDDPDLDGFESHTSLSPRERLHQRERHKRQQRAAKLQGK